MKQPYQRAATRAQRQTPRASRSAGRRPGLRRRQLRLHRPPAQQAGLGTSIIDVSDPRKPRVVSQINLEDPTSHSHKARVIGDIMIVNSERNMTAIGRKADELPKLRAQLKAALGRDPNHAELAAKLGVREADMAAVEAAEKNPYDKGGFKIYDVSDRAKPKLITFPEDARHRRAPLRHGRELRLHLDRDAGLYRQHSGDLRHPQSGQARGSLALVAAGPAYRRRREADVARTPAPPASRAADRRPACGPGCWHGGVRMIDVVRHPQAAHHRRIQLPSAVSGAVAYVHGRAVPDRRQADRARDRRRRPRARRARKWNAAAAARTAACGCST